VTGRIARGVPGGTVGRPRDCIRLPLTAGSSSRSVSRICCASPGRSRSSTDGRAIVVRCKTKRSERGPGAVHVPGDRFPSPPARSRHRIGDFRSPRSRRARAVAHQLGPLGRVRGVDRRLPPLIEDAG
jgi:hypothetical protein